MGQQGKYYTFATSFEQLTLSPYFFFFFLNLLFILNRHWHAPVFFVHPALHLNVLRPYRVVEQCN